MSSNVYRVGAVFGVLSLVAAFWWAADLTERRGNVDCELTQVHENQSELGREFAAQFSTGSTRQAFIKSAQFIELNCISICSDGSARDACKPLPAERTSTHCRSTLYTEFCRHTVRVSGLYIDDTLAENLKVRTYSKTRSVVSMWFE